MRHRVAGRKLNRTSEHRLALRRNLVASLIEHEAVTTTVPKAKEVQSFAEKIITLSKKGTLTARRRAISMLGNRNIVDIKDGEPVKTGTVVGKLFSEIGPRFLDRAGGYTRVIKLSKRRLGDASPLAMLQLLGADEKVEKKAKKKPAKAKAPKKAKEAAPVETQEAPKAEE